MIIPKVEKDYEVLTMYSPGSQETEQNWPCMEVTASFMPQVLINNHRTHTHTHTRALSKSSSDACMEWAAGEGCYCLKQSSHVWIRHSLTSSPAVKQPHSAHAQEGHTHSGAPCSHTTGFLGSPTGRPNCLSPAFLVIYILSHARLEAQSEQLYIFNAFSLIAHVLIDSPIFSFLG